MKHAWGSMYICSCWKVYSHTSHAALFKTGVKKIHMKEAAKLGA